MSHPEEIKIGPQYPGFAMRRYILRFPVTTNPKKFVIDSIVRVKKEKGIDILKNQDGNDVIVVAVFEFDDLHYTLCWVMNDNNGNPFAHLYQILKTNLERFEARNALMLYNMVEGHEASNTKVNLYLKTKALYFVGTTNIDRGANKTENTANTTREKTITDIFKNQYEFHSTHNMSVSDHVPSSFRRNINSGIIGNDTYRNVSHVPNVIIPRELKEQEEFRPHMYAPQGNDQYQSDDNDNNDNLVQQLLDGRIHLVGAPGPMGGRSKRTKRTKHTKRTKRTKRHTKRR